MESEAEVFWNEKHHKSATRHFVTVPNRLAIKLGNTLHHPTRILDLGCGQGQDSVYFASKGHHVVSADFSTYALGRFAHEAEELGIQQVRLDIGQPPFPFDDASFDVVYAHLSLHYFPAEVTRKIFGEVSRVLRQGGDLWALFNSEHDPELKTESSTLLEERYIELSPGNQKRYFTVIELPGLLGDQMRIESACYGQGTTKNNADEYVEVIARHVLEGKPST